MPWKEDRHFWMKWLKAFAWMVVPLRMMIEGAIFFAQNIKVSSVNQILCVWKIDSMAGILKQQEVGGVGGILTCSKPAPLADFDSFQLVTKWREEWSHPSHSATRRATRTWWNGLSLLRKIHLKMPLQWIRKWLLDFVICCMQGIVFRHSWLAGVVW